MSYPPSCAGLNICVAFYCIEEDAWYLVNGNRRLKLRDHLSDLFDGRDLEKIPNCRVEEHSRGHWRSVDAAIA